MDDPESQTDPSINSYALVSYIPGRLGEYLNRLRQELVAGCNAQSHVTILTPRPLFVGQDEALVHLRDRVPEFSPFRVELSRIRVFDVSNVVYLEITSGRDELFELYSAVANGPFDFKETYPYHPHITLAQGIEYQDVDAVRQLAERRWAEAPASSFVVETLTFVQNTERNNWIDLDDMNLLGTALARR